MNESHVMSWIASALQFLVAGYALRLNRRFGTSRVGWSLFGAFSLLALLQLVQSSALFNGGADSFLKINASYVLISFLLLIGMVHLEAMLKERLRREQVEQHLRADLETEVKSKTAHLTRAIEELMKEMEETKRMGAIIETSQWTRINKTVEALVPGAETPVTTVVQHSERADEPIPVGILDGELLAHF